MELTDKYRNKKIKNEIKEIKNAQPIHNAQKISTNNIIHKEQTRGDSIHRTEIGEI